LVFRVRVRRIDAVPTSTDRHRLRPKQEAFVRAFVTNGNAAAAARAAGYAAGSAGVSAARLLTKANVQEAIAIARQQVESQFEIDRQRVLSELQAAIDLAREQGNPAAMIAGWREIAKICGYYEPERKQIDISVSAKRLLDQFETMSDAELMRLATSPSIIED